MAEPSKTNQEPSMEEILSSIRRIIADEEAEPPPPAGAGAAAARAGAGTVTATRPPELWAQAEADEEEDEEVLELTEVVDPARAEPPPPPLSGGQRPASVAAAAAAAASPFHARTAATESTPAAAAPLRPAEPSRPEPKPFRSSPMPPAEPAESLISPTAASASTHAFARLTRAAVGSEERGQSPLAGVSVESLLVELLTPMLKDWLDQNLPAIVERVVEQEVKKLARRAELL